jgi:hypothetical protein
MPIEPVDPTEDLVDKTSSSVTQTTTLKTETVVAPPAQVNVILATMTAFWDWFDARDVEKHMVAIFTLYLTYMELTWGMRFAETNAAKPGLEISAILAAIGVPLSALQTAVISFYFKARTGTES